MAWSASEREPGPHLEAAPRMLTPGDGLPRRDPLAARQEHRATTRAPSSAIAAGDQRRRVHAGHERVLRDVAEPPVADPLGHRHPAGQRVLRDLARGPGQGLTADSMSPRYPLARSDPSTATPSAPPATRVVSLIADPTLIFASGSEPMIASVAGAIAFAMPKPSATSDVAISQ